MAKEPDETAVLPSQVASAQADDPEVEAAPNLHPEPDGEKPAAAGKEKGSWELSPEGDAAILKGEAPPVCGISMHKKLLWRQSSADPSFPGHGQGRSLKDSACLHRKSAIQPCVAAAHLSSTGDRMSCF